MLLLSPMRIYQSMIGIHIIAWLAYLRVHHAYDWALDFWPSQSRTSLHGRHFHHCKEQNIDNLLIHLIFSNEQQNGHCFVIYKNYQITANDPFFDSLFFWINTYVGDCALHWCIYCAIIFSLLSIVSLPFGISSVLTTSWNFRKRSGRVFCTTHWPYGPAALNAHNGFNGDTMYAIARIHSGAAISFGFSWKPHGSANIKCLTL